MRGNECIATIIIIIIYYYKELYWIELNWIIISPDYDGNLGNSVFCR
jgi:hypothetical protein